MGQGERRQDFPTLWEGVGPDTPIPNEAKGEYAKLNYWGNSPEVRLLEVTLVRQMRGNLDTIALSRAELRTDAILL
jgi:hypothetical protein